MKNNMDYNQIKIGGTIISASFRSNHVILRIECKYYLTKYMYETNTFIVAVPKTLFLNNKTNPLIKVGEYVHVEGRIQTSQYGAEYDDYMINSILIADEIYFQEDKEI